MAAILPRHKFPFEHLKDAVLIGYAGDYDVYTHNIELDTFPAMGWLILINPIMIPELEVRRALGGKWVIKRRAGSCHATTIEQEDMALAMLNDEEKKQYLGDALDRLEL